MHIEFYYVSVSQLANVFGQTVNAQWVTGPLQQTKIQQTKIAVMPLAGGQVWL